MGFHRMKGKLHQVVVPVLVCLVLVMSLNVYMRRNIYDTKEELLLNAAKELQKVVTFSWRSTLVQLQAKRALSHIHEILEEFNVDIPSDILDVMQNTADDKTHKSVCPEQYLGTKADYPWFEKGRILTNCSDVEPFESVLSILLNGFDYASESQLQVVLREIYATYPRLTVHLAVREKMIIPEEVKLNVLQLLVLGQRPAASDVWNRIVATASTYYVLVGRRIERFQWYALLERMVRVVTELGVDAVGGSLRTPDGHWSMGCQQTRLRNYTLTYRDGYHMSTNSCAYCDYIPSPFVSRTSTLRAVKFKMVSPNTVFHDYFLRLTQEHKLVMSCPDSMFYVLANNENASSLHQQWLPMTQAHSLNRAKFADGRHLSFSCHESLADFEWSVGIIVPICEIETLRKAILETMALCREIGLFCQLQEGTALGALKFNSILPWERDACISYMTSNGVSFLDHRDKFIKLGYKLSAGYSEKCHQFEPGSNELRYDYDLHVAGRRIVLGGVSSRLATDFLRENRIESTKLLIGGRWVNAPTNPALTLRNRYGYELLRHAEYRSQFKYATSSLTVDKDKFTSCPYGGSQTCLDQYPTDGNVDFIYQ